MSTATEVNPRLAALTAAGVSVWLDQIRRSLIEGGELARLVAEESLRGVTANPSIFEKAILGSNDYDDELERAGARAGSRRRRRSTSASRSATCSSRPTCCAGVHREHGGRDGFVSLEVAPGPRARHRADARRGARTYWKRARPPQRDDQDPRHARGRARDRAGDLRGDQRQRHAAVLRRGATSRSPRPTSAGSSAATPRASRSTSTRSRRFFVSRVDTNGRQAGSSELGRDRPRRAPPRSPTRAPRTCGSRRSSPALAGRPCATPAPPCSARCGPRPAPRTRTTPDTKYVDELVGAAHRQHDADGDAARGRRPRRGRPGRPPSSDPHAGARGARRGRHRHATRSPTSCSSTASSSSRTR